MAKKQAACQLLSAEIAILVLRKPAGILCVPTNDSLPSAVLDGSDEANVSK